jgi:hypothetical protein
MRARAVMLTLALCFVGVAVSYGAADAFMGTWKLNEANSKLSPGNPKNDTVVYEALGDSVKVTIDGTGVDGSATHNEWTGKFDGKDYPVTGDSTEDARALKKINDHTLTLTVKKDGKIIETGRIVVSADGKTRTVTTHGTDAKGMKVSGTAVYDKQ